MPREMRCVLILPSKKMATSFNIVLCWLYNSLSMFISKLSYSVIYPLIRQGRGKRTRINQYTEADGTSWAVRVIVFEVVPEQTAPVQTNFTRLEIPSKNNPPVRSNIFILTICVVVDSSLFFPYDNGKHERRIFPNTTSSACHVPRGRSVGRSPPNTVIVAGGNKGGFWFTDGGLPLFLDTDFIGEFRIAYLFIELYSLS